MIADLVAGNVDSLEQRRNCSVYSSRVGKGLFPLTCSCNACILRHWRTSCRNAQTPEPLELLRTFRQRLTLDPARIELPHQNDGSSVRLSAHELRFLPISLPPTTQSMPELLWAPLLCFRTKLFAGVSFMHKVSPRCEASFLQRGVRLQSP